MQSVIAFTHISLGLTQGQTCYLTSVEGKVTLSPMAHDIKVKSSVPNLRTENKPKFSSNNSSQTLFPKRLYIVPMSHSICFYNHHFLFPSFSPF